MEEFPVEKREREARPHVEAEEIQQEQPSTQSASAVAVASFSDHEQRNHSKDNQTFIKENDVI